MRNVRAFASIFATLLVGISSLPSQDMFPVRQLTSDPAQEGFPSWSPDAKTIVYSYYHIVEGAQVPLSRKIPADGGTPVDFTDFPTEHPQWSPDGRFIVFDADTGTSIEMVKAEGGSPIKFLPDSISIYNGGLPCWSPDGSSIAFKEAASSSLCVYDVKTGSVAKIFRKEGMMPLPGCWTRDGKSILLALMDRKSRSSTMWKISSDGREREQIKGHREGFYRYLALSPDGTLLVYGAMGEGKAGLWIMLAKGGKSLPLAVAPDYHNQCPSWSPDGKGIAFASGRTGRGDIYIMDVKIENVQAQLKSLNQ